MIAMTPRLIVQQKITAFVNKYKILVANPDGSPAQLVGLAQQKRLAFKEKVIFYTDETRANLSFTFRAEKVMDIHGRYFVEDASGKMLGGFKKEFMSSLVSSTWKILDANGNEVLLVKESNATIAALRRFIGVIPIVGDIGEMLMVFFKYHFIFVDIQTNQIVGTYTKTTLIRDNYQLATTDEIWQKMDWRVLASMSVALDALQSR